MKYTTPRYEIYDRARRIIRFCDTLAELYEIAVGFSLYHRAAVYFGEDATEQELIADLEGINCRVTINEEE